MTFDDLLNAPYKVHGRDKNGFDCYGLVIECCRRVGTPLRDVYYETDKLPVDEVNDYINKGINVRKIDRPKKHCIVEMVYNGNLHVGFLIDRNTILHTTKNGVKTTSPDFVRLLAYYEVIDESDII